MFEIAPVLQACHAAAATYDPSSPAAAVAAALGVRRERVLVEDSDPDLAALVLCDAHTVLLFRGTNNKAGWVSNFDAPLVSWRDYAGKIHQGFGGALARLSGWITAHLPEGKPVLCAGHSRGGALAVAAAQWLFDLGEQPAAVTFGAPMTFDAAGAAAFKPVHLRVTHDLDLVPHEPSEALGYRHTGVEYRLYDDGRIVQSPGAWQRVKGLWAHLRQGLPAVARDAWQDHGIEQYAAALGAAQAREQTSVPAARAA